MAHPHRYDDRDVLLAHVRQIALELPSAKERISHGCPNWFTTKTFAGWHAHVKGSHDSDLLARALWFLPDEDERDVPLRDDRFHVPGYIGHRGWLALDLAHHLGPQSRSTFAADDARGVDWVEVAELIDMSYRNNATKKLVAELDSR
ncbi:MmcQ/YjbR family DNA-binding protein [Yimella sp. cx-573]|nr:MmcQ/YjbR family DNA-binding protein [Yimella sp. cx-573]